MLTASSSESHISTIKLIFSVITSFEFQYRHSHEATAVVTHGSLMNGRHLMIISELLSVTLDQNLRMSLTTAVLCFEHSTSAGKEFSRQKLTVTAVGKRLITRKLSVSSKRNTILS